MMTAPAPTEAVPHQPEPVAARPRGDLRMAALIALLVAVTLNRYTLPLGGLHVKLEHVVLGALLVVAAWQVVRRRGTAQLVRGPLLWIIPYVGVTGLASAVNAPNPGLGLRYTGLIALVAAGAGLVYWLANTRTRLVIATRWLAGLGVVEAVATFGGLVAAWFWIPVATQPGRGETLVPFGTLWEPNILGSYLAAASGLLLAFLLAAPSARRAAMLALGLVLVLAALALSLARAAWAGAALGALVVLAGYAWHRWATRVPLPHVRRNLTAAAVAGMLALLFLGVVAPFLFPATVKGVFSRVDLTAYDPRVDPSVQKRVDSAAQALDAIRAHPILGNGAGSYGMSHVDPRGAPGWLANLELHLWHDSGLLGLVLVLGGLAWLTWRALRTLGRAPPGGEFPAVTIGLLAAGAGLLVAFQATEATWLGYPWVYVGLLARAGGKSADGKRQTADHESSVASRPSSVASR
ncbi:MAG TPA: O-antigen ligase family protein [Chloroflexia bacterium]|nr:O-antigen ligase family protein [Chloroflexia bacterium]